MSYHASFTLLSEDSLVLARCAEPYRPQNDVPEGEFGFLDVYRFNPRATESTWPLRVASFALPVLSYARKFESLTYLGCAPTAKISKTEASSRYSPNAFELAPQNRLLCLDIFTTHGSIDDSPRSVTDLCIPSSVILDALPSSQEYTIVPWVDWAEKTSWANTNELGSPHKRSGFGQRIAGFDRRSFPSEPKLVVLDFDQQRVKSRAMPDTHTIWEVCTPGGNILGGDKYEHMAEAVFCGREDLARRRYMRAVFPVQEQVEEADKVMIDDERGEYMRMPHNILDGLLTMTLIQVVIETVSYIRWLRIVLDLNLSTYLASGTFKRKVLSLGLYILNRLLY